MNAIIHLRTLHTGPDEILVAAKIAVDHDDTAAQVAEAIDGAERRIREAVPQARYIFLEPDLQRPAPGLRPRRLRRVPRSRRARMGAMELPGCVR